MIDKPRGKPAGTNWGAGFSFVFISLLFVFSFVKRAGEFSFVFISLLFVFIFIRASIAALVCMISLGHGIWFGLSEFGAQHILLCSQACSALQTFGLDFIAHAVGNDAGDDGGSEIDLGARASDSSRGEMMLRMRN